MKKILDIIQDTVEKKKCPKCGLPYAAICRPKGKLKYKGNAHFEADEYENRNVWKKDGRSFCN